MIKMSFNVNAKIENINFKCKDCIHAKKIYIPNQTRYPGRYAVECLWGQNARVDFAPCEQFKEKKGQEWRLNSTCDYFQKIYPDFRSKAERIEMKNNNKKIEEIKEGVCSLTSPGRLFPEKIFVVVNKNSKKYQTGEFVIVNKYNKFQEFFKFTFELIHYMEYDDDLEDYIQETEEYFLKIDDLKINLSEEFFKHYVTSFVLILKDAFPDVETHLAKWKLETFD